MLKEQKEARRTNDVLFHANLLKSFSPPSLAPNKTSRSHIHPDQIFRRRNKSGPLPYPAPRRVESPDAEVAAVARSETVVRERLVGLQQLHGKESEEAES